MAEIGQPEDEGKVVVRGDPGVTHDATPKAAMDERILTPWSHKGAQGCHRSAAGAEAVSGHPFVHVARVQAGRAVVAMSASTWQGHDERAAMPAPELLGPAWSLSSHRRSRGCRACRVVAAGNDPLFAASWLSARAIWFAHAKPVRITSAI